LQGGNASQSTTGSSTTRSSFAAERNARMRYLRVKVHHRACPRCVYPGFQSFLSSRNKFLTSVCPAFEFPRRQRFRSLLFSLQRTINARLPFFILLTSNATLCRRISSAMQLNCEITFYVEPEWEMKRTLYCGNMVVHDRVMMVEAS